MIFFLVQRIGYIEDHYPTTITEALFATREIAEKWIKKKTLREAALREARDRSNEITKAWSDANPFFFNEVKPKRAPRWSNIRQSDITPEMRAVREAANKLEQEYHERWGQAHTAHYDRMRAHLADVWAAEGRTGPSDGFPHLPHKPSEYEIEEMVVRETDDLEVETASSNVSVEDRVLGVLLDENVAISRTFDQP